MIETELAIESAAKALWESESHPLMARAGHVTDWENLNPSLKKSVLRKAKIVIKAYEAAKQQAG